MLATFLSRVPHYGEVVVRGPLLLIGREAWVKLLAYARLCETEINGFAYVTFDGKVFRVPDATDVFITDQVVSLTRATAPDVSVAKALDRAMADGRADELRLQWHSHGSGSVHFSPIDQDSIDGFGRDHVEWYVSLVLNHFGECRARLDHFRPMPVSAELSVAVVDKVEPALIEACLHEIEASVTVVYDKEK